MVGVSSMAPRQRPRAEGQSRWARVTVSDSPKANASPRAEPAADFRTEDRLGASTVPAPPGGFRHCPQWGPRAGLGGHREDTGTVNLNHALRLCPGSPPCCKFCLSLTVCSLRESGLRTAWQPPWEHPSLVSPPRLPVPRETLEATACLSDTPRQSGPSSG